MASSRESSPARRSNPSSPAQLTPNSKVKAMLAALDNDSDDESIGSSARANLISKFKRGTSKTPGPERVESPTESASNKDPAETEKDSEDEEDEEEIVRPKGRMAARMQAAGESSEDDVQPENARERVKKLLVAKSQSPEPSANNEGSDGSVESDVPVVSRKRKIRTTRQETPKSTKPKAAASPGLFVSPSRPKSAGPGSNASDSDELPALGDDKFKALVERKRKELQERQKEAAAEKAKKLAERKRHAQILEEDELELSDEDGRRRLTQPIRKAGKKAQEEIRRETQRMSRNQQLAHNATTKKKFSKKDFFARMNYRQDGKANTETTRPTSSSSAAPHSDVEMKDTPPTSPASSNLGKPTMVASLPPAATKAEENDDDLPTLEDALAQLPSSPPMKLDKGKGRAIEEPVSEPRLDKGKGRAIEESTQESKIQQKKFMFTQPKIRQPKMAGKQSVMAGDSDSDLEIVSVKTPNARNKKLDSIFNRIPEKQAKESHSLHALRMLAHLTSPGKKNLGKNRKPGMTTSELQVSLQQRARQQATREREERLQALREKGVIVQTAEEREKENAEVEDLVERARREGEEIQKREKAAAKKERKDRGEVDPLGDDSSDDEDWEEEKGKAGKDGSDSGSDMEEIELSGSEDGDASGEEEDEMELDGDETAESKALNPLFDNEASDTEDDEAQPDPFIDEEMAEDGDIDEDEEQQLPVKQKRRRNRNTNVISDDESEDRDDKKTTPAAPRTDSPMQQKNSPAAPNSVLRSATKTFIPGLTVTGPVGLGLTQIFAGTMDESQEPPPTEPNGESQQLDTQEDSMAFLKRFNAPELPPFVPTMEEDTQTQDQDVVMDSQPILPESQAVDLESQKVQLQFSQSQMHDFGTLVESTQMSPFPATQDVGFQHMTPIRGRFVDAPPSTVETVILDPTAVPETMDETPIAKKKGKLRRRAPAVAYSDEEDLVEPEKVVEDDDSEITADAFDVMRKASRKKPVVIDEFDKKNSKAKEMVHEQAEESEDEYAGLGGASDDESGGEEDALVKAMVDDEGGEKVDERKLAAFFADRERASDEKQVEKLYKDITNGMLRRKRGADYDLSDSDDGGEAKRRRKRADFAKMRKALLSDERIGKIAENPKRQAFLRAIEDRGSEDEMDFLDDFAEQDEGTDSQSQSQAEGSQSQQVVPDSQPTSMGPPKRKHSEDPTEVENRPPPNLRRTKNGKKPSNLTEIRESLSSLIEEPNAIMAPADSGSESEDELDIEGGPESQSQKENKDPFALRRGKVAVIDRISLKRASSNSIPNNTRLAFATSSSVAQFKVPPLLRRATTNSSIASSTTSSVSGAMSATERMAGGAGSDGVKRGGGRNSGVNYFARETERRANVVKTEKRRQDKRVKGAEGRRKVVGGLFGGGKFE
ncbi:Mediator of replication checkpoint protein 1 [Lachnellula arida]|uniref:Mediator of replication checkpoint protein 1 n=1 Tax=Lachnellula arida TaxID=1316785 RepID=A0A8T9B7A9_9HELO|nr:Mediator of replication checkpoint protein 1 [Lachnellula arida]